MIMRFFCAFMVLSNVSLLGDFGVRKEVDFVANRIIHKIDENYITLLVQWRQCLNASGPEACRSAVNKQIKESLKQDLRAVFALNASYAVLLLLKPAMNEQAGNTVHKAYTSVVGIPLFIIDADAFFKAAHLVYEYMRKHKEVFGS